MVFAGADLVLEEGLPAPCVSAVKTAMLAPSAAVSVAAWSCANTRGKYSFRWHKTAYEHAALLAGLLQFSISHYLDSEPSAKVSKQF